MRRKIAQLLKQFGILQFAKYAYKSFNYEYKFTLNGSNLKGLKIYGSKTENSETWMGQVLSNLFKLKMGAFIDVGVNIGQTLLQVKSLDIDREYIGFEPNPSCNMFVEELIRINKFSKIKLVPVGLFTKNSLLELDLYYDDITNSGGSVIKDYWTYNDKKPLRSVIVPLMDFSTIMQAINIPNFDIVKIDVEGAELEVLESIAEQIKDYHPFIIIEVLSAYSANNTLRVDRQKKILELVNVLNYKIFRIIEDENNNLNHLQEIKSFDPEFNHHLCNYIFCYSDEVKMLESSFIIKNI